MVPIGGTLSEVPMNNKHTVSGDFNAKALILIKNTCGCVNFYLNKVVSNRIK